MLKKILIAVAAVAVIVGIGALRIFTRNETPAYSDPVEHFKFASVGAEERTGVPLYLWKALPVLCAKHLPDRVGEGWEKIGFVREPGSDRFIGTTRRTKLIEQVGLNCAACHTGTVRVEPDAKPQVILGMPNTRMDIQAFVEFLVKCKDDPAFEPDQLLATIKQVDPDFGMMDGLIYRYLVIPATKAKISELEKDFGWFKGRPAQGIGRVDTFNPYYAFLKEKMPEQVMIGTADFPPLFAQEKRWTQAGRKVYLHWDGNNDEVEERNKSAAIGAGCSEDSIDLEALQKVVNWIKPLEPPAVPKQFVDPVRADRGKALYAQHCSSCHAFDGERMGEVTPLELIMTDRERVDSFTPALAEKMNTIGTGKPWKFSHFRKTNGYANMPLDGVWLRAPYLHNGSVPTMRDLLKPPSERPTKFYRGYDLYDFKDLGFVHSGPEAEQRGVLYDTTERGNGNGGHLYGTDLDEASKDDLIEYLKLL